MAPCCTCAANGPTHGTGTSGSWASPARLSSGSRLVSLAWLWLCLAGVLLRSTVTDAACPNPLACLLSTPLHACPRLGAQAGWPRRHQGARIGLTTPPVGRLLPDCQLVRDSSGLSLQRATGGGGPGQSSRWCLQHGFVIADGSAWSPSLGPSDLQPKHQVHRSFVRRRWPASPSTLAGSSRKHWTGLMMEKSYKRNGVSRSGPK